MSAPLEKSTTRNILILALLASALSLATAYIAQYRFNLTPCELCLKQRIPYAVVIVITLLGLFLPRLRIMVIVLAGVAFLAGAGIAGYHTAVEKHWVQGPSSCTDTEAKAAHTIDDLLKKIEAAPITFCDQPQWEFHGITMAAINAVWSLFLTLATFAALQHNRKKEALHA